MAWGLDEDASFMKEYCISKVPNAAGHFLVHRVRCYYLPKESICERLGEFPQARDAVLHAAKVHRSIKACAACIEEEDVETSPPV